MEWMVRLTRVWRELLRDVLLTGAGLAVIGSQVAAASPNAYLIGAGLSLTFPSTFVKIREILVESSGTEDGPGSPSAPLGPAPPSAPSAASSKAGTGD